MTAQSLNTSDLPGASPTVYLKLDGITVRFLGVLMLGHVSFDIRRGKVHGPIGKNGAGKSTLLKVLSSVNQPEADTLSLDGVPQQFTNTCAVIAAGIAVIYQELYFMPELTVAESLMLGALPNCFSVLDEEILITRALHGLERLGERFDPAQSVKHPPIGQRQMTEIGKALMRGAHVTAFDEPTNSLSLRETTQLLCIIRALKAESRAVIYVTHRTGEVYELYDHITAFHDGRYIDTFNADAHLDHGRLVRYMVGRSIQGVYDYKPCSLDGVKVDIHDLMGPGLSEPVSFQAHTGEIVGFFGLVGAGRSELMKLLYGAVKLITDEIRLNGKRVQFNMPRDVVRAGVALCPGDCKQNGIVATASASDNLNISCRCHFSCFSVLSSRQEAQTTQSFINKLVIKTCNGETPTGKSSGDNQRKVILLR